MNPIPNSLLRERPRLGKFKIILWLKQGAESISSLALDTFEIVNGMLIIRWSDGQESYLEPVALRDACPCAECGGETDALGNVYGGDARPKGEDGYHLVDARTVGHYALQPFWQDGHNTGIYRFEILRELGHGDG